MKINSGFIKKLLVYAISVVTLTSFTLILTSGSHLKQKLPAGIQVEITLLQLEKLDSTETWDEAITLVEQLDQAWSKIAPWLQISSEGEDIKQFSISIQRLAAHVQGKNTSFALAEIRSLRFIWDRLGV